MYTLKQRKAISQELAEPKNIPIYRKMMQNRGLPSAGMIMKNQSALAAALVYILLEHCTEEEIRQAVTPSADLVLSATSVPTPVQAQALGQAVITAPVKKSTSTRLSKFEEYPDIAWTKLDNPLIRMADSIYTDRINCWSELRKLENLTQNDCADLAIVENIVNLSIRLEMCFSELRNFNATGQFLGRHPFISAKSERERVLETLKQNPETYFQERKNIELNITRYRSQLKKKTCQLSRKIKSWAIWNDIRQLFSYTKTFFQNLLRQNDNDTGI